MNDYPFSVEHDERHPWDEIDFLQDYICKTEKPGSHEIVGYMDDFEGVLQPVLDFIVKRKPADATDDIALDRMTLRYLVKHLDWISRRVDFVLEALAETVANYDVSHAAIEPLLELEFFAIWRQAQHHMAERETRDRRLDDVVLARIVARRQSGAAKPAKAKRRAKRQAPRR